MLMKRADSALLVVDMQARLLPMVTDWQRLLERVSWLVRVARELDVPLMVSEQNPKGIGATQPELAALFPPGCVVEKTHFSCVAAGCLKPLPAFARPQVVVCGIEAHVCVLQTALELLAIGKQVFVVADAIASRAESDKSLAEARLRAAGAVIVSREMAAFEWLHQSGTDEFRRISKNYLR